MKQAYTSEPSKNVFFLSLMSINDLAKQMTIYELFEHIYNVSDTVRQLPNLDPINKEEERDAKYFNDVIYKYY